MFEEERKVLTGFVIVAVIAVFLWVSEQDYQHELAMEKEYREMVCAGHWPDYWQTNPNCEDKQ
jgi:hypothetical protein